MDAKVHIGFQFDVEPGPFVGALNSLPELSVSDLALLGCDHLSGKQTFGLFFGPSTPEARALMQTLGCGITRVL